MLDSELIRELRLQAKIYTQAADILGGKTARTTTRTTTRRRSRMSAAGRRRIALAQKKRWAATRKNVTVIGRKAA